MGETPRLPELSGLTLIVQRATSPDLLRQAEYDHCLRENLAAPWFDEVKVVEGRPTFTQHFEDAPPGVCVLANSDITFDRSILLALTLAPHEVWCLTRWDDDRLAAEDGGTQDVWVFRPPLRVKADWQLGIGACDTVLSGVLEDAGYQVENPARTVRAHHHHASGVRTWGDKPYVQGRWLRVPPTKLRPVRRRNISSFGV